MTKQFGGRVTKALQQHYEQSSNWRDGRFQNIEETTMNISILTLPKILYRQFCQTEGRTPKKAIPFHHLNKHDLQSSRPGIKMAWYGHSAILLHINNYTILIDPMFGPNAAPSAPFSIKRFSNGLLTVLDHIPQIDLVLLSHDHYDHLDLASINVIKQKAKTFFTALGVKRHLVSWGIEAAKIKEFDWWQQDMFNDIKITFTPTRHFSGRGLSDRAKSIWGGWAIHTTEGNYWFSGDSGYGNHFKEIGKRLGPFDFAWMECGQYNEHWHQIHMFPEESIQAALDAKVKCAMPVHWAGFALAQHQWVEPVNRFLNEAGLKKLPVTVPELGQLFNPGEMFLKSWWHQYD